MNQLLDRFNERPLSQRLIFAFISFALLGYLFWSFFYSKRLDEYTELSSKIDSLKVEIINEKRLAKNLSKFEVEVRDLNEKLEAALQRLPDKREVPDFLRSIEERAKDSGLAVSRFQEMPERPKEFFAEIPVEVAVDGTFHQVVTFFDEVARLPRIVNINGIALKQPVVSDDEVRVKVEFSATTFRYMDDAERAAIAEREAEANKKKSKRKRG